MSSKKKDRRGLWVSEERGEDMTPSHSPAGGRWDYGTSNMLGKGMKVSSYWERGGEKKRNPPAIILLLSGEEVNHCRPNSHSKS